MWFLVSLIAVVLLIAAGIFYFVILPKQHEYVFQPNDVSRIIKRPSQPACDLNDLKGCPTVAPSTTPAIVHPRFGMIIKDEVLVVFRKGTAPSEVRRILAALPGDVVAYQPVTNEYEIHLHSLDAGAFEQVVLDFRQEAAVLVAVPNYAVGPSLH